MAILHKRHGGHQVFASQTQTDKPSHVHVYSEHPPPHVVYSASIQSQKKKVIKLTFSGLYCGNQAFQIVLKGTLGCFQAKDAYTKDGPIVLFCFVFPGSVVESRKGLDMNVYKKK